MTIYKLKEILDSQYNRTDVKRQKTCRAISHMSIDDEITDLSELLTCLGNANTSEFVLDRIPNDYLYLNDIFEWVSFTEYKLLK